MKLQPAWPPRMGDPLPRAGEAYAEPRKLTWLLSDEGHGREWARVLRIDKHDIERFWEAIARGVLRATIFRVIYESPDGAVCGAKIELTIGVRSTNATTSWHYAHPFDAPRLVTAYPIR